MLFKFHDVFSLEEETWKNLLPEPVIAVVLLYSVKDAHNDMIAQEVWESKQDLSLEAPFFIK